MFVCVCVCVCACACAQVQSGCAVLGIRPASDRNLLCPSFGVHGCYLCCYILCLHSVHAFTLLFGLLWYVCTVTKESKLPNRPMPRSVHCMRGSGGNRLSRGRSDVGIGGVGVKVGGRGVKVVGVVIGVIGCRAGRRRCWVDGGGRSRSTIKGRGRSCSGRLRHGEAAHAAVNLSPR